MVEALATYSFIAALAILVNATRERGVGLGAFLTGLALVLRPQCAVLLPGAVWVQFRYGRVKPGLLAWGLGLGLAIFLSGALDRLTWGGWFHSTWQNVYFNIFRGVNKVFGTQPWYFYLPTLVIASCWIFVLAAAVPGRYRWLWLLVGIVLISHSLIPHKEYRFIFVVIPLLL